MNDPQKIEDWENRFYRMIHSIDFDAPLSERDYNKFISFFRSIISERDAEIIKIGERLKRDRRDFMEQEVLIYNEGLQDFIAEVRKNK